MPTFDTEDEFEVFDDPATSSSTQYRFNSSDGATSLLITGTGFTYVNGIPTGGTITSVAHVVTANGAPIFTITNINVSMADVGALLNDILGLRSQITWADSIEDGDLVLTTSNLIRFANGDGTFTEFIGSGFPVPPIEPLVGAVTAIRHVAADGTTILTNVNVNETLAFAAAALFEELASDQLIFLLNTGANTITGGGQITIGDTTYVGVMFDGPGSDTIVGAGPNGTSYIEFELNTMGGTINLATGVATFGADTNTLSGMISGVGGTEFNDTITGTGQGDQLTGWGGDDVINGGGGNDFIAGAEGADTLNGGDGVDTVVYDWEEIPTGVTVSLAIAGAQNTGGAGVDTLSGIENLWGSFYNDTLTGDNNANSIRGLGGNDIVNGGAGADHLEGDDGNDIIFWDPTDAGDVWGGGGDLDTIVFIGTAPTSFNLGTHGFEYAVGHFTDPGGNPWATRNDRYDSLWRLDATETFNDNGVREATDFDQASTQIWSSNFVREDALHRLDVSVLTYDDATRAIVDYDEASAFSWVTDWHSEDALLRVDTQVITYDNGTRVVNDYDQADAFDWLTDWHSEDAVGQVDTQVTTYDDGTLAVNDYDQGDAFDWVTDWHSEDALGRTDTQVVTFDDGRYAVLDYDQADDFDWATMWWLYDSNDNVISFVGTNDDGSTF